MHTMKWDEKNISLWINTHTQAQCVRACVREYAKTCVLCVLRNVTQNQPTNQGGCVGERHFIIYDLRPGELWKNSVHPMYIFVDAMSVSRKRQSKKTTNASVIISTRSRVATECMLGIYATPFSGHIERKNVPLSHQRFLPPQATIFKRSSLDVAWGHKFIP